MSQRFYNYRGRLNINIDEETCTCCALCYDVLPSVFANRGDGIPIVLRWNLKEELIPEICKVAQDCPSSSIILDFG